MSWPLGRRCYKETREKISKKNKGKMPWNKGVKNCFSKETLEVMSEKKRGRVSWKKGLTQAIDGRDFGGGGWNRGLTKFIDDRVRKNGESISKSVIGKSKPWLEGRSRYLSPEIESIRRIKHQRAIKRLWLDPNSTYNSKEYKEKKEKYCSRMWKDESYQKKQAKARNVKPNCAEIILIKLLAEIWPNMRYVGNYSFYPKGCSWNPDFVDEEEKKVIEHFGIWWHGQKFLGKSEEEHEKERIEGFKKFGYDTLIVWESELKNLEQLRKKVLQFRGGSK